MTLLERWGVARAAWERLLARPAVAPFRPTIRLLFVLLLALLFRVAVARRDSGLAGDVPAGPLFPGFARDKVERIEIGAGDRAPALVRKNGAFVVEGRDLPASRRKVDALLDAIASIAPRGIASRTNSDQKLAQLGIGSFAPRFVLRGAGNAVLATLVVGRSGADPGTVLVRKGDGPGPVLIAAPNAAELHDGDPTRWLDLDLVPDAKPEDVQRVTIRGGDASLSITRQGEGYALVGSETATAKRTAAEALFRSLVTLTATDISTTADTGLAAPERTIEVALASGRVVTLSLGKEKDADRFLATSARPGVVFVGRRNAIARLPLTIDQLRESELIPGSPEEVVRLDVRRGEQTYRIARDASSDPWRFEAPESGEADWQSVRDLLVALQGLRYEAIVASPDPKALGLEPCELSFDLKLKDGREVGLEVGKLPPGTGAVGVEGLVAVRKRGQAAVYQVRAEAIRALKPDLQDVRGSLLPISAWNAAAIQRQEGASQLVLLLTTRREWIAQSPASFHCEQAEVEKLVRAITAIKRGPPAPEKDPRAYELDKPRTSFTIVTRDNVRHGLFIGKEVEGKRAVTNSKGDPIVLVPREQIEPLLVDPARLRDRHLFGKFVNADAFLEIAFGAPGADPTTLRRDPGGTWRVVSPISCPGDRQECDALALALGHLTAADIEPITSTVQAAFQRPEVEVRIQFRNRSTQTLFLGPMRGADERLAALLGGGVAFVLKDADVKPLRKTPAELKDQSLLQGIPFADVRAVALARADGERASARLENGRWLADGGLPADRNMVDRLTRNLAYIRGDLAPVSTADAAAVDSERGLAPPRLRVELALVSSATYAIDVGAVTSWDAQRRFVRIVGEPATRVAQSFVFEASLQGKLDFADPRALPFDAPSVVRASFERAGVPPYELVRELPQRTWKLSDGGAADSEIVDSLVAQVVGLQRLRIDEPIPPPDKLGLDPPRAVVKLELDDHSTHALAIGERSPTGRARWARLDASPDPIAIAAWEVEALAPPRERVADRTALALEPGDVVALRIERRGDPALVLARSAQGWRIKEPGPEEDADPMMPEVILGSVRKLRREDRANETQARELDKPLVVVTFSLRSGASRRLAIAELGQASSAARVDQADAVVIGRPQLQVLLDASRRRDLVDRRLFGDLRLETVQSVTIRRPDGRKRTFVRDGQSWKAGDGGDAPRPELLSSLCTMRGAQPAGEGDEAAAAGLSPPEAIVEVAAGGHPLELTFGRARPDGFTPARLATRATVLLVWKSQLDGIVEPLLPADGGRGTKQGPP